jgi:L-amino acid N-acyltransferase YncA
MRVATEKDLPAIVGIYNSTVPTRQSTADTTEVSVALRLEWFRQHVPDKRPLLVHEQNGRVVAWASFQWTSGSALKIAVTGISGREGGAEP